jgi:hypothetical protein
VATESLIRHDERRGVDNSPPGTFDLLSSFLVLRLSVQVSNGLEAENLALRQQLNVIDRN